MEGAGYFRSSRDIEEGPHQNEENKKWRGPVISGSSREIEEGPHQNEENKKVEGAGDYRLN